MSGSGSVKVVEAEAEAVVDTQIAIRDSKMIEDNEALKLIFLELEKIVEQLKMLTGDH